MYSDSEAGYCFYPVCHCVVSLEPVADPVVPRKAIPLPTVAIPLPTVDRRFQVMVGEHYHSGWLSDAR